MKPLDLQSRVLGSFVGLVVGDALGVPVEFCSREELRLSPVTDMIGGGFHGQPPGTWSDDTSLALATADALVENGLDLDAIARNFVSWLYRGEFTPWGNVFDVGNTTRRAIERLASGVSPTESGISTPSNGSLMRILPVALYLSLIHI